METPARIQDLEMKLIALKERKRQVQEQMKKETLEEARLKRYLEQYEAVRDRLIEAGNGLRQHITAKLGDLVTSALRSIYESEKYSFSVRVTGKGRRLNVEMAVKKGDLEGEIEDNFGGGVADVVSTVLRLAIAERFGVQGPLLLDEPARMMRGRRLQLFAELLHRYSHENGRQLIVATHSSEIADRADAIFKVSQVEGDSEIQ